MKSTPEFILAGLESVKYNIREYQLEKGDIVFVYTDGITEATNSNSELFGEDRLIECLNNLSEDMLKPEIILEKVLKQVNKFVGKAPQFDDETMVCFSYKCKAKK